MKYKEALQVGTQAEGTIQCTYATIYDRNGRALFSLQRGKFWDSAAYKEFVWKHGENYQGEYEGNMTFAENYVYTGEGKEGVILWTTSGGTITGDQSGKTTPTALIRFDVPLVVVDQYSKNKFVPCKLLYPAVEYLRRTIESGKKLTKYIIYKLNEDGTKGKKLQETYTIPDSDVLAKEGCTYDIEPLALGKAWEDLLKHINADDVVYVKPAAFRWNITQVRVNAVVDGDNPTDPDSALGRVYAARKKYEQAKAVLVAAGLTNFI